MRLTVEAVHITIITRSDYSDGSLPAVLLLYHVRLPMAPGGEILGVVFGWGTKCNRMVMVPRRWNRLVPFVCFVSVWFERWIWLSSPLCVEMVRLPPMHVYTI
uniref:Uncharacterized protein n=1 Tax=Aegilops tauschii subsp. strangulata TaxID=200361 RepID=A0A452ZNJ3_AEGTS